jgi:peptidoglycan/LPS O-acetylase OafA/YrhL
MWSHTWSLAVEEHFYILLVGIIFLSSKYNWIRKKGMMTGLFSAIILIVMLFRFYYVQNIFSKDHEAFFYTHLRMDGLFTGALLGYLWHFRSDLIQSVYSKKKMISILIFFLLLPAFILKTNNTFMLTFGFNLFHLGCALVILLLLESERDKILERKGMISKIKASIGFIGIYSYSIYLWHLPVQNILLRFIPNMVVESVIYIILSLAVGIGMSLLIEKPMLKLRERFFPGK